MKPEKIESELKNNKRNTVPIHVKGIGTRISAVSDLLGTRKSAANAAGVSVDTLQRYIREDVQPSIGPIVALAYTAHVSLDWLSTGNGFMRLEDQATESAETAENQRLQDEQWLKQQEKFKKGLQLMFEMSKDDPSYNPDGVWSALLVELLAMHGLHESGYQRILETLKMLKKRDEDDKN